MEVEYFAIFYLLRRETYHLYIHLVCLKLLRSRYSKQLNLPLIKSDYLVVSGISFHGYPVPLCAFLFLSTVEILSSPLSSPYASVSISRHLVPNDSRSERDRHSEPRPFSAHGSTSLAFNVRCTNAYTFARFKPA